MFTKLLGTQRHNDARDQRGDHDHVYVNLSPSTNPFTVCFFNQSRSRTMGDVNAQDMQLLVIGDWVEFLEIGDHSSKFLVIGD